MRPGYICVAGLNLETGKHIRPILEGAQLGRDLLVRHGGPFDIASVVDLGATRHTGVPPETEDYVFDPNNATRVKDMTPEKFWELLVKTSHRSLGKIFGGDLKQKSRGCVINVGKGKTSLGCLCPSTPPEMEVTIYDKIRINLTDSPFTLNLSVTDLRLYKDDHVTPRRKVVEQIAKRVKEGVGVILSMGLTRPWTKPGDNAPRHWLQVNNIHLEDDPTWQLG